MAFPLLWVALQGSSCHVPPRNGQLPPGRFSWAQNSRDRDKGSSAHQDTVLPFSSASSSPWIWGSTVEKAKRKEDLSSSQDA